MSFFQKGRELWKRKMRFMDNSLFQAPRDTREGECEGTKTRGEYPRFRPLALSFARLSRRSLEQAIWIRDRSFFMSMGGLVGFG